MILRIATRKSRLALWQANWVREKILENSQARCPIGSNDN